MDTPLALRLPKAAATKLAGGGIETVRDLLHYAPFRYYQWGALTPMSELVEGEEATIQAQVAAANLIQNRSGSGVRLVVTVTDGQQNLQCTFFAKNHYMLNHHRRPLSVGANVLLAGKVSSYRGQRQMVQPEFEQIEAGSPQDAERRAGRPIPIYRSVGGLPSWKIGALVGSLLDDPEIRADLGEVDVVGPELRARHGLFGHGQAIQELHQPGDKTQWRAARRTLAWEEALVLQTALIASRRSRASTAAALLPPEGTEPSLVDRLIGALPFELTGSQVAAWEQLSGELAGENAMQRLLQGDVGSGKTVVALLAMLRAVESGKQAALLAPTEVLARQHWASLARMIDAAQLQVPVHLLTSKRAAAEKSHVLGALASGEPGIVVGTHALLQQGVELPELGLLVVDEQHRFGVAQREQLREGREAVPHLLVMTATPIPRTIAMTVFGDLDVTAMTDLPAGRSPVQTFIVDQRNDAWMGRIWERAREEVERGGRVYVVCPRIEPTASDEEGEDPKPPLPAAVEVREQLAGEPALQGVGIGLAHGRQKPEENAAAFARFASGDTPVLVATTVVEVGVDVPEATMMVILDGTRFGLSQLHQLRGRVGRSDAASVCMITHPGDVAPTGAERLRVIAETTDGFALAEADLRLRSEGNVLGKNQSGRLSSLEFLSVRRDAAIIAAARDGATGILDADPALGEHPALAAAVQERTGEELVWMEKS